jgi:hypothetical protein
MATLTRVPGARALMGQERLREILVPEGAGFSRAAIVESSRAKSP